METDDVTITVHRGMDHRDAGRAGVGSRDPEECRRKQMMSGGDAAADRAKARVRANFEVAFRVPQRHRSPSCRERPAVRRAKISAPSTPRASAPS